MGDRRRHQRFVMADACEGTFQLLEDVTIEEVSADELRLVSVTPARPGGDRVCGGPGRARKWQRRL